MNLLLLFIAFVLSGLLHVANKALHELGLDDYRNAYVLMYYACPMLLGAIVMRLRGEVQNTTDRNIGLFMGFCGALSLIFMLIAIQHMPGIVVFPIRSVGNLVLTAVFSVITWRERLSKSQWVGMLLSLLAIWLVY